MVGRVTRQSNQTAVFQQVAAPSFEVLSQGTIQQLSTLDEVNTLFEEGDLGELQLFLRNELEDSDRADVEDAIEEMEAELMNQGALPWPGRDRIATLDWPNRTVRLLFQQGFPLLLVLIAVMVIAAGLAVFTDEIADALRRVGIPVPESVETAVQATALFVAIATSIFLLRGLGLPLIALLGGGLLIFVLLSPETAFRVLKWSRETLGPAIGFDPVQAGIGAVLGVGGVLLLTQGGGFGVVGGIVGVGAGSLLILQSRKPGEGDVAVPDSPPRPERGAIQVVGNPTVEVVQI